MFLNNPKPFRDPFLKIPSVNHALKWKAHKKHISSHPCFLNFYKKGSKGYVKNIEKWRNKSKKCILIGYEDFRLDQLNDKCVFDQKYVGKSNKKFQIVLVRDIFNNIASRLKIKMDRNKGVKIKHTIDIWKGYMREVAGETSILDNKVFINYNDWFYSEKYRRSIADVLGLEYIEDGLNAMSPYGGGSSFNDKTFKKAAQKMDVEYRWKHYRNDKKYWKLFKNDEELVILCKRFFPRVYDSIKGYVK
jgi:hypothetical protein